MKRFEKAPSQAMVLVIGVSMALPLVADLLTPLEIAVWVLYFVPVALSLFVWQPRVPFALAALATILIIFNFFASPSGLTREVAALNRAFGIITVWVMAVVAHQLIRNKLAVVKQDWLQSGQMQLATRTRGDLRPEEIGENALCFLAEYLDAQSGAFFIEESGRFRKFATFAVPERGVVPESVVAGDGLLGQAVKDSRSFVVNDVPEGYLAVGSGLGMASPRHLVIAPVTADNLVNGVLELGFFHPVYESDTEFLNRVSEMVGVSIRSAMYRRRLHELLEETQRQAQEVQAQSEELRVANEELEEQGRSLKESQSRLELQQIELEQTNMQLEEQTQLLETQKDDLSRSKAVLESQARELEQSSQYKSDFLANMSHELRTPLNSSLILAKLLADNREGNLTEEQVKYAETISSAGNDLLNLINDILDLSKIEAGRMEVVSEDVVLSRLLENLGRSFRPFAEQKGLELRIETTPGTPTGLTTDPRRLEQILKNLLSNAIKFTEKGEIVLTVSSVPDGGLAFAVRDTGIGIAASQREIIFEAFRQADSTTSRKFGGTGLGLSISRELTRLLGGSLHLASEPGRGSTFTVTLPPVFQGAVSRDTAAKSPIAAPIARPEQTSPVESFKALTEPSPRVTNDDRDRLVEGMRLILVIEDDVPFARILYDLAREQGLQSIIETTADEGFAAARQYLPSAIILDIGLPDASGLSVLDRVKGDVRTRHIPVHVISASDYMQTALSLGAVGYLMKPVRREQLVEALQGLESRLNQRVRRVLIVEDDPVQRESLGKLLASGEVETVGVGRASECLEQLKTKTFDCMVMDLSLPDTSGFTLLDTLSREEAYSFPPVIVYTGRELTADEEQQLRRYSRSIIIKGAKSPERLLDEVTLFLHQVVAELPPEQRRMLEQVHNRDTVLEGRKILIVEDDVRNVFAITSVLEPYGVDVCIARNGREALAELARRGTGAGHPVDLVLMDIMMPEMDGLTAMQEIRKQPALAKLPIIALTAKAMKSDQEQCLAAGANDYMAKPIDIEKLLSLIRVWMPR